MRTTLTIIAILPLFLTIIPLTFAETFELKSGKVITGRVVNETSDAYKVMDDMGYLYTVEKKELKKEKAYFPPPVPMGKEGVTKGENGQEATHEEIKPIDMTLEEQVEQIQGNVESNFQKSNELIRKALDDFKKGVQ